MFTNPPIAVLPADTLYWIRSPVSNKGAYTSIVLLTRLTALLSNGIIIAESIIIVGNTAYPLPGLTTVIDNTLSKFITATNSAKIIGSG